LRLRWKRQVAVAVHVATPVTTTHTLLVAVEVAEVKRLRWKSDEAVIAIFAKEAAPTVKCTKISASLDV